MLAWLTGTIAGNITAGALVITALMIICVIGTMAADKNSR